MSACSHAAPRFPWRTRISVHPEGNFGLASGWLVRAATRHRGSPAVDGDEVRLLTPAAPRGGPPSMSRESSSPELSSPALARASGPRPGLVRVVERDPDDPGRDAPWLGARTLDLEAGAKPAVRDVHAGEREIPLEYRRQSRACHDADDSVTHHHVIAVRERVSIVDLETDEDRRRVLPPPREGSLADEVVTLRPRHDEADPCLEGVLFALVFIALEDKAGFYPQGVECIEPERTDSEWLARFEHGVPDRRAVIGVTPHLIAELARVPGSRQQHRRPVRAAKVALRETEPLEVGDCRTTRRGLDKPGDEVAAPRTLNGDVVDPVRRVLKSHLETETICVGSEPVLVLIRVADPPEPVRFEAEHCPVVDHVALVVAERRIDDMSVREPAEVAGHHRLEERSGTSTAHLDLTQRS